ncbi:MAG: hypothetical protein ABJP48_04620 [Erythrobacter sp.]
MIEQTFLKRIKRAFCYAIAAAIATSIPAPLAAQDSGWKLDPDARFELGLISAQSTTRDDQIIVDGDAVTLRAQIGVDLEDDDTRFRLEADRIEVIRLGDGRSDTNRDRITALFEQEIHEDWEIQLRGRYFDDLVTAESSNTDEIQASARVSYEPTRATRVRLRATWREREYDNGDDPQTRGDGPRVDAQYRHRFGRYNYLTFDLRAESIDSADPERGFRRGSAKVSYTQPITPDLRVRPAFEILNTRFDQRFADDGTRRNDTLFAPEVEVHWWPDDWRVELEAKYIFSNSNVLTRDREGYRVTFTVGHVF